MVGYVLVVPVLVAKSYRQHVMLELALRSIRKTVNIAAMIPFILVFLIVGSVLLYQLLY
jgi:hypothetical protein